MGLEIVSELVFFSQEVRLGAIHVLGLEIILELVFSTATPASSMKIGRARIVLGLEIVLELVFSTGSPDFRHKPDRARIMFSD